MSWPAISTGLVFGVHDSGLCNVLRGLRERVFLVQRGAGFARPPRPAAGVFQKLSGFRSRLLRALGSCRPWTVDEFVNSYKGAKQRLVRAAAESLSRAPLTKRDAKLKTFVKAEKLNLSKKADPAPRVIQPRDPRYNAAVGPYIKSIEHRVYGAIAEVWGGPTVMKGMDARAVAAAMRSAWDEQADPVGIGFDASRFDQHVSSEALRWEHSVYNSVFRCPQLRKWLSWQLHNVGVAHCPDGVVNYEVDGCRMSGDMNTALGNCLLMCAMMHRFCEELGIDARLFNNGDDCVLIVPRSKAALVRAKAPGFFLSFGFTMKMEEPVDQFERLEFCQCQPVWAAGWIMVRNPLVAMSKDTVCLHPDSTPYREWLYAIGECGLALSSGVPVMQEFYLALMRNGVVPRGDRVGLSGMVYLRGRLPATVNVVSDRSRVSFYHAFGIPPSSQVLIEQELRGAFIDSGPMTTSHHSCPTLTGLLCVDIDG